MNKNMHHLFSAGDIIYGYCNGFFGRDDYEEKTCILVTPKYAVFQYENGFAAVLNYNKLLVENGVEKWKQEEQY